MPTPSQGSSRKKSSVPDIDWKANNGALLWQLIGELEKPENFRVLFGKRDKNENTSGDRKITVYKRVAQAILPDGYAAHPNISRSPDVGKKSEVELKLVKCGFKVFFRNKQVRSKLELQLELRGSGGGRLELGWQRALVYRRLPFGFPQGNAGNKERVPSLSEDVWGNTEHLDKSVMVSVVLYRVFRRARSTDISKSRRLQSSWRSSGGICIAVTSVQALTAHDVRRRGDRAAWDKGSTLVMDGLNGTPCGVYGRSLSSPLGAYFLQPAELQLELQL
ncbi:hypothetical protein C8Q72DRAFT_935049 [Fomitopsis betulina]|nr:hypothetical protein C8Q72DRAFT_935049 [Fomitopsis betulina]